MIKKKEQYKYISDVEKATDAHEYLNGQLQKLCVKNGDCKCMEETSKQTQTKESTKIDMPEALDDVPNGYEDRCKCPDPPKPCDIVKDLFENKDDNKFTEACSIKYKNGKEKYTQWKCINDNPSTHSPPHAAPSTSLASPGDSRSSSPADSANSDSSATCIPPRRQQMYIQPLQSLSGNESPVELRTKFIEMAAIETFFQWHKFKKEKVREIKEKDEIDGKISLFGQDDTSEDPNNPQNKLNKGEISDEFKRQMFYTLGDYRDICIGGDRDIVGDTIYKDTSDKDKEGGVTKKISEKIKENLSKQPGTTPVPPQTSVTTPQTLWDEIAPYIWKGMVCALTYKENGREKPQVDPQVQKAFFGTQNGKPGTYTTQYDYEKVTLENSGTEAKPNEDPLNNPKLKDFVEIPTYFRWLHEWGSDFCGTRKRMLGKIKEECTDGGGNYTGRYCGGDGFDCKKMCPNKDAFLEDFTCQSCAISCRKYKKWIVRKKEEFDKQKEAYKEQKTKCQKQSETAKEFCGKEGKCETAAEFLQKLRSCKTNEHGKNKSIFDNTNQTFVPAEN
ncbi:hypothetical protein PFTANZ_06619, partial [Plasmodium falciparum Tanzania (2000708)]